MLLPPSDDFSLVSTNLAQWDGIREEGMEVNETSCHVGRTKRLCDYDLKE